MCGLLWFFLSAGVVDGVFSVWLVRGGGGRELVSELLGGRHAGCSIWVSAVLGEELLDEYALEG